jgi:hypothetical protein
MDTANDVHTKFHKDSFRHFKVDKENAYANTKKGAFIILLLFSQNKESLKTRGRFRREKNMPVALSICRLVPEYLSEALSGKLYL